MNVSDRGRAVIRLDDDWKADACSRVAPNSSQFNGCRPCTTSRLTAQFDRSLRLLSSLSQDFLADFAREQRPSVSIGLRYFDRISTWLRRRIILAKTVSLREMRRGSETWTGIRRATSK